MFGDKQAKSADEVEHAAHIDAPMPSRINARNFKKAVEEKFGETAQVEALSGRATDVPGEQFSTRKLVKQVMGKIKETNSVATRNLIPKIKFSFEMSANIPAVWDDVNKVIVLNASTSLSNPDDLPFIVAHEAAHGGLLRLTKGKPIIAESMADLAAKLATGKTLDNNYGEEGRALKGIANILDVDAKKNGFQSGEYYVLDLYARYGTNGGTKLFQALLKVFMDVAAAGQSAEEAIERAPNEAMQLFNKAFPDATVSYTGNNKAVKEDK